MNRPKSLAQVRPGWVPLTLDVSDEVLLSAQGPLPPYTVGPEALGQPHDLLPAARWRHEWKDLVRHNPLTTTKDMALDGHGVDPQLVDHIEAQKDQDTATLSRFVGPTP